MKTFILLTLFAVSAFAQERTEISVTGNFLADEDSRVMIYGDYTYRGRNPVCLSGLTRSQRVMDMGNDIETSTINSVIPLAVQISRKCQIELNQKSIVLIIGKKLILENIILHGGRKINYNTYEFRGGTSGLKLSKQTSDLNNLKCNYDADQPGKWVASCDQESFQLDDNGAINLNIILQ